MAENEKLLVEDSPQDEKELLEVLNSQMSKKEWEVVMKSSEKMLKIGGFQKMTKDKKLFAKPAPLREKRTTRQASRVQRRGETRKSAKTIFKL
ncbi:unnamed protein product [Caenorhabditis auriculariae]|uniref:Uncharacterized protein n=1 Tax=Caenorhabditis auriculariae TaxID=2777116 RepID=A0A8S1H000_9PELO|nr:unnamed protein product [Caenorhabditis auriculariae]